MKTKRLAEFLMLAAAPFHLFPALLALCWSANAETVTVSSGRPVSEAALKLQTVYGWAITYEDLPRVYESDLEDVTSTVRKDGKSASEPGIQRILTPLVRTFSFAFDPPGRLEPGTRAPEGLARRAILDMLKSYSESIGGVEMFTLTDSNGLFHIIPTQRRDASGKLEKIVPLLDTPVVISPGGRRGIDFVEQICRSLASQSGSPVGFGGGTNLLFGSSTQIASAPGETARSLLSRFFAEVARPRPVSWGLNYQPIAGYALNVRFVDIK